MAGTTKEIRVGKVISLPTTIYRLWGDRRTYISQLELLAVLVALTEMAGSVRGTSSIWFTDNIAALMALVKGSSGSESLDKMAQLVHLACFAIRSVPYFEYIESKSNWADEISREGARGTWAPHNAFSVGECGVIVELLTLPCVAIIKIFEYL